MEAIAGISLAANVIQFIDFSSRLISKGKEIHENGSLSEQDDLENVTRSLAHFSHKLRESLQSRCTAGADITEDDKNLERIATECSRIADQLLQRLQRLKYGGKHRPWKSFRHALKSVWAKAEIDNLAARLAAYRQQLALQNQAIARLSTFKRFDSLDEKSAQISNKLEGLSKLLVTVEERKKEAGSSIAVQTGCPEPPRTEVDTSNHATHDSNGVSTVPSAFQSAHHAVSTEQFHTLQDMIRQLQTQVAEFSQKSYTSLATEATKSSLSPKSDWAHDGHETRTESVEAEETSDFAKSIEELCRFASKKGTAMFSEDAQIMIECLDEILAAVESHEESHASVSGSRKRKRPAKGDESGNLQTMRSVKRVRGLLRSAQSIAVNQPGAQASSRSVKGRYHSTNPGEGVLLPIFAQFWGDEAAVEPETMSKQLACKKILLENGADPTLTFVEGPSYGVNTLYDQIPTGVRTVEMMLDLAADFIDLEERILGNTYVLKVCQGLGYGLDLDILNALIRRGSDLFARNQRNGDTCLHQAVRSLRGSYYHWQTARTIVFLVTLLNAGLKVSDKNNAGETAWDLALKLCLQQRRVFEEALDECGIDMTGFPSNDKECPRARGWGCYCKKDTEKEQYDDEDSDLFECTDGPDDSSEVTVEQSEAMGGILFEPSFDQRITEIGDDRADAPLNCFATALNDEVTLPATQARHRNEMRDLSAERQAFVTQCQLQRSKSPMLNPDPFEDSSSYAHATPFSGNEMNGLQMDEDMYSTDACSQATFSQQHDLRPVHASPYDESSDTASVHPPTDPEQRHIYCSTSAWATNHHSDSSRYQWQTSQHLFEPRQFEEIFEDGL
ncbi:hypothetical protein LTR70_004729 [Exophiala xenobiotica]|uniref:Fungal N-terminal domain-containing protein n=1 Tax=Lithohypha guttulata TaxID=1690604 RepID=A0ABR0KCM1_9EURO|nr:hypothetical protein LTR24_004345 [Lithohypha guttulata]KAK5319943.1 hypothetical protein LTR70_004729 [Exophiala xenobiotica]